MPFETIAQEKTYNEIGIILQDVFPGTFKPWGQSSYMGIHGTAVVFIGVAPWGANDSVIRIISYVVSGAKISDELMNYLLRANAQLRFGAFGLDDDNDIFLHHTIRGNEVNPNSLSHYVAFIASEADKYDDQLVEEFGGMTAIDHLKKTLEDEAKRQPIEWS